MTDQRAQTATDDGAAHLCAMSRELLAAGEANLAVRALLRALSENRRSLDAHRQLLHIIWRTVDEEIGHLGELWAKATLPGLSVGAAEEFLIDTFGDHPDRYELFLAAANFAMRRGEVEQAEDLLSYCLQPTDGVDWQKLEVKGKYDDIAASYEDDAPHREAAENFRAVARRSLDGTSGLVLVDVACGTGALAAVLRPHAAVLIGSDLSSEMALRAQPHYDRMLVADMTEALTSLGMIADVVMCFGALYYSQDIAPFLAGAATALKPGGRLLFSDFAAPEREGVMVTIGGTRRFCRSPGLLRALAKAAGFAEVGCDHGLSYGLPVRYWHFVKEHDGAVGR